MNAAPGGFERGLGARARVAPTAALRLASRQVAGGPSGPAPCRLAHALTRQLAKVRFRSALPNDSAAGISWIKVGNMISPWRSAKLQSFGRLSTMIGLRRCGERTISSTSAGLARRR